MSRGLIYSTRGVTASIHESLIQQMKIVETNNTKIDFLSSYKTDKPKQHIQQNAGITIDKHLTHLTKFYYDTAINMSSWNEIYDALDVNFLKEYDDLYLFGGIFSTASGLKRYEKRMFVFPKDSGQIKFESVAVPCVHILALLKANNEFGTRLHEIVFDPLEMSLDLFHVDYAPKKCYNLYHGYDKPSLNMKRLDSLQYFLSKQTKNFIEEQTEKDIDITFGMTIFQNFRQKYEQDAKTILNKFDKVNFYVLNKVTGENTFVDRAEYLKQIARSKYTIILPAYDSTCFSIFRLLESLHNDCLPLIHEDCYLTDINKSYNTDLNELVTDKPFSENERVRLLNKFKKIFLTVENKFIT
jgi:hypothetical protein